ncbi:NUDIX hydrolase [Shewanella marina]|uniref:NUDIX hydrolase n=1 Tax=Shewanella marina TaxID=487319 RepID=UPI00046F2976|nr:NUDIX hydrolase [Shewanella marina]
MSHRYRPNVTVACIIHHQHHFVMVEELIDNQIKFNQPAGHLEANESIFMACQREIKEETGLDVAPQHLLGIDQYSASNELAFLRFTFIVELDELLPLRPLDPQIKAAHWLHFDEILHKQNQLRSPLVLKTIDDYYQGKQFDTSILNSDLLLIADANKA